METINVINGKFELPVKHILTKEKRTLTIKTPWSSCVQKMCKDDFQVSIQQWFRRKGHDKPYIPEGFIDIDGIRYIAKPHTQAVLTDSPVIAINQN